MTLNKLHNQHWIWLIRLVWLVLFLVLLAIFVGGVPYRFAELIEPCSGNECPILTLSPLEMSLLENIGVSPNFYAVFHIAAEGTLAFFLVATAALFVWRRFDDVMGIFIAFFLLLLGLNFMVETDTSFFHHFPSLTNYFNLLTALALLPLLLLPFIFPNGRFVPRWTRFIASILVFLVFLDPLLKLILATPPRSQFSALTNFVMAIGLVMGIVSQAYRYRSISTYSEKQQTKWVIFGISLVIFCVVFWAFFFDLYPPAPGPTRLLLYTAFFSFAFILLSFFPISIVIAITRHNLYDVDLIIRRTLLYSLLSAILAGIYFTSVLLIQSTLTSIGGQQSAAVTVISTLIIAALFNPLRQFIQTLIDKRFYRRKYDAQQTLANFAATARDEVDLEKLSAELVTVIRETMQPESVSLWLKPTADRRPSNSNQ